MNVEYITLALIRSEICGEPVRADVLQYVQTTDTQDALLLEIYELSKKHDMAHIAASAISKLGLDCDKQIADMFEKELFTAIYRVENLQYELERIKTGLNNAKIKHVVLKGSVIRNIYPESWMRTSCDIDILVEDEQIKPSCAVLRELGYRFAGERGYHDVSFFTESGFHIELHFSIDAPSVTKVNRLLAKVWDHCERVSETSSEYVQNAEFFVFYHVAHMAYHFAEGGCGIRAFADLHVLESKFNFDRNTVEEMCEECGISVFYKEALRLISFWFGNGECDDLMRKMHSYVLEAGVYGAKRNKIAAAHGRTRNGSRYIASRIFLPYNMLEGQYPVLKKHKILLPFCHICRWCKLLLGGKAGKLVREMEISRSVSRQYATEIAELFDALEIQ